MYKTIKKFKQTKTKKTKKKQKETWKIIYLQRIKIHVTLIEEWLEF